MSLRSLLPILLILLLTAAAGAAAPRYIAVGERNNPPLEFLDVEGKPSGFSVEMFKLAAEHAGIDCEVRLMEPEAALDAVLSGRAHFLIGMVHLPDGTGSQQGKRPASEWLGNYCQAQEALAFAKARKILNTCFVCRADHEVETLDDLSAKLGRPALRILVKRGDVVGNYFRAKFGDRFHYQEVHDTLAGMLMVQLGDADAFVIGSLRVYYYLEQLQNLQRVNLAVHSIDGLPVLERCMASLPAYQKQLDALETSQQELVMDGTALKMERKWLGAREVLEHGRWRRRLVWGALAAALLALAWLVGRRRKTNLDEQSRLLNGIDVPVELLDRDGRLTAANQAFLQLMGLPALRRREQCVDFMKCPLGCEHVFDGKCLLKSAQDERRTIGREVSIDGRSFAVSCTPVVDAQEKVIAYVNAYHDIHDLQEQRRRDEILTKCMEVFFSGIDLRDAAGRLMQVAGGYLGADKSMLMHYDESRKSVAPMLTWPPEASEALDKERMPFDPQASWYYPAREGNLLWLENLQSAEKLSLMANLASGLKHRGVHSLYVHVIQVNGHYWGDLVMFYRQPTARKTRLQEEVVTQTAHLLGELLAREENQGRLVEAMEAAQKADRAKSYFMASVSHELRTPLNSVLGFTELLKAGDVAPEEMRRYLENIGNSAHALQHLVDDLLELSSMEAGEVQLNPERADVPALARSVLGIFEESARGKHLALRCQVEAMPALVLDVTRMRQILFNLVSNAVKFTTAGEVVVKGSFEQRGDGTGALTLSVSDTGIGIEAEDVKKLTEPFVQLSRMRGTNADHQGSGLGLTVIRKLITAMQGTLDIESTPGKGSTFTVRLHRVLLAGVGGQPDPVVEAPKAAVQPQPKRLPAVLVVDDVDMNLRVMSALCRKCGFAEVVTANSGKAALEALAAKPFGLVFTDLWMPAMDGGELTRRIRQVPSWRGLPVIAVTADTEATDHFSLEDFTAVMNKPVSLPQMSSLVEKYCAVRSSTPA